MLLRKLMQWYPSTFLNIGASNRWQFEAITVVGCLRTSSRGCCIVRLSVCTSLLYLDPQIPHLSYLRSWVQLWLDVFPCAKIIRRKVSNIYFTGVLKGLHCVSKNLLLGYRRRLWYHRRPCTTTKQHWIWTCQSSSSTYTPLHHPVRLMQLWTRNTVGW